MLEFFAALAQIAVPLFVVLTMLNVGLTQKPSRILSYWKEWRFVLKMLAANFVLAPLLMIVLLRVITLDRALEAGLLINALCAGAPFLIKLTAASEQDVALGAATMLLLMLVTVIYVPIVLPMVLEGLTVDAWAIAQSLLVQLILPLVAGVVLARVMPDLTARAQPWVGKLANIALYLLLAATFIGHAPGMLAIVGTGAILVAVVFVLAAFGIGHLMASGRDHLEDVGGLATAQRNTAAGAIVAAQNFDDANVLVMMMLANVLGVVMLLGIARLLRRDNAAEAAKATGPAPHPNSTDTGEPR